MKNTLMLFAMATMLFISSCGNKKENKTTSESESPVVEQSMEAEKVDEAISEIEDAKQEIEESAEKLDTLINQL